MHDRMLISHDEVPDVAMSEAVAAPQRKSPAMLSGKMQALFALLMMGLLPVDTYKWVTGALGHMLRG